MTRYRWTPAGGFEPAGQPGEVQPGEVQPGEVQPGEVQIVDSWLVADGRVRAFEAHTRRFSAACAELSGLTPEQTREFMGAVAARLPTQGRWFPRAELAAADPGRPSRPSGLAGTAGFQLWIRPAPPPSRTVRLWLTDTPDARTYPQIKGPDLGWLASQREAAVAAGADEAVLLSRDGRVLEGSTTSIVWWYDDKLCAPGQGVLPSVTRSLLLAEATAGGVPVGFGRPRPAELAGREVWAVNALHGIRPVTAWVGAAIEPGPASRAAHWQRYLAELAVPIGTEYGKEPADVGAAVPAPPA